MPNVQNVVSDCQTSLNVAISLNCCNTLTNYRKVSVSDSLALIIRLDCSVTYLIDEVDHGTAAAGQEAEHHPFALMSRREMALDENDDGQWESRTSEVELGIVMAENQPDELH